MQGRRDGAASAPQCFKQSNRTPVENAVPTALPQPGAGIPWDSGGGAGCPMPGCPGWHLSPRAAAPCTQQDAAHLPQQHGIVRGKTCPSRWCLKATDVSGLGAQKQLPGASPRQH